MYFSELCLCVRTASTNVENVLSAGGKAMENMEGVFWARLPRFFCPLFASAVQLKKICCQVFLFLFFFFESSNFKDSAGMKWKYQLLTCLKAVQFKCQ